MPPETNDSAPEDEILLPHMKDAVSKLAREMGYEDPRFEPSATSKPGEDGGGYLSYTARVKVTSNSKPNPLHLIVKTSVQNESRREALLIDQMFPNEMNMYSIILPAFAEYMHERGVISDKHFPGTPRCYTCKVGENGTEIIIMEDLKASGFQMVPERKKGMSKEYCKLVLRFLAMLHSTTRAFKIDKPEEFEEKIRPKVRNVFGREKVEEFAPLSRKALEMTEKRFPEGTVEREKLRRLIDNYTNEIMRFIEPDPDGFNVVTHGDCWANNMMFKIDPVTGKPTQMAVYDFQMSRYATPIGDLFYFLFLNTTRDVRGDLSEFLNYYVDEFNKNLRSLGCTKAIITLEKIQQEAKKYGRCGITEATVALPVMLSESTDVPDMNEAFDKTDDVVAVFSWECKQQDIIEERLCDVLEESIILGYL